jgi:hypothetical protein
LLVERERTPERLDTVGGAAEQTQHLGEINERVTVVVEGVGRFHECNGFASGGRLVPHQVAPIAWWSRARPAEPVELKGNRSFL